MKGYSCHNQCQNISTFSSLQSGKKDLVKLDPSLTWEVIAPPEVKKHHRSVNVTSIATNETIYWSSTPSFTLSSAGLGVESTQVPTTLGRPLLLLVFAPSNGFNESDEIQDSSTMRNQNHHYDLKVCIFDFAIRSFSLYVSL